MAFNPQYKVRVLVADDSALQRRTLIRVMERDPHLEIVGYARDGEDAVAKARDLRPDVISMDINMPKMDGLTALQIIMEEAICPVVMVSSLTQRNAQVTFEALELGAFDYVAKPDGTVSGNLDKVARELCAKLRAAAATGVTQRLAGGRNRRAVGRAAAVDRPTPTILAADRARLQYGYKAVAIGISTGGPSTLMEVIPKLPADLNAAVFIVQHMPAKFTTTFAERMAKESALRVVEAQAMMPVEPGLCFLGQGGFHLTLYKKSSGEIIVRTPTTPEHMFMPSADVMMDSVLAVYGRDTVGVLMTGIGSDGAESMLKIHQAGGVTLAESEESAVVFGMPREAIERGAVDVVAPCHRMADEIIKAVAM